MMIYMEVTPDKYRLPLAVANSVRDLAKLRKVSPCTIYQSIKKGGAKGIYIKVEIEDGESDGV